jgi:hypothetical protein
MMCGSALPTASVTRASMPALISGWPLDRSLSRRTFTEKVRVRESASGLMMATWP